MGAGLGAARAMKAGTVHIEAGLMLTPELVGGTLDATAHFTEGFYGFAKARGGYSFLHGQPFGEAFAGIGIDF